jgi:hypothetical protein
MAKLRLEGLRQMKNPMTSSAIEPVALRLVAQCLNQIRYRVPPPHKHANNIYMKRLLYYKNGDSGNI